MTHPSDIARHRDQFTRRFGLVLRPSYGEIVRFREEAAALLPTLGTSAAAEAEAAKRVFLVAAMEERASPPMPMAA